MIFRQCVLLKNYAQIGFICTAQLRHRAMHSASQTKKGLVLGYYSHKDGVALGETQLSQAAQKINQSTKGRLLEMLQCSATLKSNETRILYGLGTDFSAVAIVGYDRNEDSVADDGVDRSQEHRNIPKENARCAAAAGVQALRKVGIYDVSLDSFGFADAAAEGAVLSLFAYDELKSKEDDRAKSVQLRLYEHQDSESSNVVEQQKWKQGVTLAEGQNLARHFMEMPANLLSPSSFAKLAEEKLSAFSNVKLQIHDFEWAKSKGMGGVIAVAQGSAQPLRFLEITYKTDEKQPLLALVGKGVCFDSGGISIKPAASMDKMRADMGGAAVCISTIYTLCRLDNPVPCNIKVFVPLVENMPSGTATRPGDIVRAMNGKSIKIDNTDAEGRLILADALCYADTFNPSMVIDLATLTGAIHISLGSGAAGVFTNSDFMWKSLYEASLESGDRVWRLPLFKQYRNRLKCDYADINNIAPPNSGAGSCVAASFLKDFTNCEKWAHVDIAGVMDGDGEIPYIPKGMTGRPLRTLMEFIMKLPTALKSK